MSLNKEKMQEVDLDIKKTLLEQAKLLEDYNKKYSNNAIEIRENTAMLMQIYSYIKNLQV